MQVKYCKSSLETQKFDFFFDAVNFDKKGEKIRQGIRSFFYDISNLYILFYYENVQISILSPAEIFLYAFKH